jgi:hypothetical protein
MEWAKSASVRVIVPRRTDGGHRDRLWQYCKMYWAKEFPQWEILEGHHHEGPFNRSAAINGAAKGTWDVAIILDADVILDSHLVVAGINRALQSGCMVLPFRQRLSVSEAGTRQILDGYQGSWARWVVERQPHNVSTCVVVPRELWNVVGGFDERFEGWGGEDDAFHAACHAMKGVVQLSGEAWHLWHPTSPWRDHGSPLYREALALSDRYVSVAGLETGRFRTESFRGQPREAMGGLLAESRAEDQIVAVCLTNGRRDTLSKSLQSADEMLGAVARKVLVADCCRPRRTGWDTVVIRGGNYPRAVAGAIDVAISSGQPWIFWIEDDFVFNGPVDLQSMQSVMRRDVRLAQVSLKRQAWYPHEVAAGGMIEANPGAFAQRSGYCEHSAYWTMNPMLTRRRVFSEYRWPAGAGSERRFGDALFARGRIVGMWGEKSAPPAVTHIGASRAGSGY